MFCNTARLSISRCIMTQKYLSPRVVFKPWNCFASASPKESDVIKKIEKNYANKIDMDHVNLEKVISYLLGIKADADDVERMFCLNPSIGNVQIKHWDRTVNVLLDYGFTIEQIINIIFKAPVILGITKERILSTLHAIQAIGISSQDLVILISNQPHLINANASNVQKVATWLKTVFPKKDIANICINNPSILHSSESELQNKLLYMVSRMGLEQPDMKNNVWSYPLSHLQVRHEFLERVGSYVQPNPKTKALNRNVSLSKILNSPDNTFAVNFAKVTLEEYEIFCRLAKQDGFLKEWNPNEEMDDDEFSD